MRRVAVLLALAIPLLGAGPAHAAKGMEVAVQDDPLVVGNNGVAGFPGRDVAFGYARELNASRVRINVVWSSVVVPSQRNLKRAPHRIKYDFSGFDAAVVAANHYGVKPQLTLTGPAPAFATGNHKVGPYKPKARYYRAFVAAVVKQYKGLVDRYAIWNEPNHVAWLAPVYSAPRLYRTLYKTAYKEIRHRDRKARILIGETSPYGIKGRRKTNALSPIDFLRRMTCSNSSLTHSRCRGLIADGYAHHPYDFGHKPTYRYPGRDNATLATLSHLTKALSRMARSRGLRDRHGHTLYVYLTEYGYFRSGKYKLSETRRRNYLVEGFRMAQRNRRVKQMLQYLLVTPGPAYAFFDTSIVSANGGRSSTYKALQKWSHSALKHHLIKKPAAYRPTPAQAPASQPAQPTSGGQPTSAPPSSSPPSSTPPSGGSTGGSGSGSGDSGGGGSGGTGGDPGPLCTVLQVLCP